MERFNAPEDKDAVKIIQDIEEGEDDLSGIEQIAIFCAALWFSNYKDYQNRVKYAIQENNA